MTAAQDAGPPAGRRQIRRAVLAAARTRFARVGLQASLREIAADARVNPGLIHRHIGRKEDLVAAVIEDALTRSRRQVADLGSPGAAVAEMFRGSAADEEISRLIAWLALESPMDGPAVDPLATAEERTVARVRALLPRSRDTDLRLMLALTVVYGWPVFRRQILSAFEAESAAGPALRELEDELATRLARLVDQIPADPDGGR